ncbi:MAG: 3-keto-5-aminohexanoate cleavage protein [Haloarculaceae archaeon]
MFNNGHLNELHDLVETGVLDPPYYVNLIFGRGTFAIPSLENVMNAVRNLPEDSIFNVLATGPHQLPLTTQSVLLGGHVRVGMEDNLYYRRGEPATGNPQLVERSAEVVRSLDREPATPGETREMLGI